MSIEYKGKALLWCSVLFYSIQIFGQGARPGSLEQLIQASLQHYPRLLSGKARVEVGKALVLESEKAWIPNVRAGEQINLGSDNSLNGAYFSLGFVPSASGGRRAVNRTDLAAGNILALTAEWEAYNFGAYGARTQEAKSGLGVEQANLARESFLLESELIAQYFEMQKTGALLKVQERNVQRLKTIHEAIRSFTENGLRPAVDTSISAAELSKARLSYLDLSTGLDLIRNRLALLTGLNATAIQPDSLVLESLASMLALASATDTFPGKHPSVVLYESIYQNQLARQETARRNTFPKFYVMGSAWLRGSSISPTDVYDRALWSGLDYTRSNYLLGAAITYNLTDPARLKYRMAVLRSQAEAARQQTEEQKMLVRYSLQESSINLRAAQSRLSEIPVQNRAAEQAYGQRLALYKAGLTDITELMNALNLLNRAETDAILARDLAWRALIQRAVASNQLDAFVSGLPK